MGVSASKAALITFRFPSSSAQGRQTQSFFSCLLHPPPRCSKSPSSGCFQKRQAMVIIQGCFLKEDECWRSSSSFHKIFYLPSKMQSDCTVPFEGDARSLLGNSSSKVRSLAEPTREPSALLCMLKQPMNLKQDCTLCFINL